VKLWKLGFVKRVGFKQVGMTSHYVLLKYSASVS